jgi:hypothetical protein
MVDRRRAKRPASPAGAALTCALCLAGCGSDGPPEQARVESPALSGTATYDETVSPNEIAAKGAAGSLRTASNSSGTNQYHVSLVQLTGPYMLRYVGTDRNGSLRTLFTVATQAGHANITPLTTLLVAQLLGQDPEAAWSAFGPSGGVQMSLITEASIVAAQEKVTAYLRDTLGVEVKSGSASFITSPFTAASGDPMLETLVALDAALAANGRTLSAVSEHVASLARLCLQEKIEITVNGQPKEFCPATKTATPEQDDTTILDYVFVSSAGDTLTLRVQENSVLSGEYVSTTGDTYTCIAQACGAIALGAPESDLTRSITFGNSELSGAQGHVVLNGSLMGPIPGVAIPVLPCDHNKFIVILPERRVAAECVEASDPLNLGGTLSHTVGATPSRAVYTLRATSKDPARPQLEVVMDANDRLLSVYFSERVPGASTIASRFACETTACNGVTLGPVTVDTDVLGPDQPVMVRTATFDDTVLPGLAEDGSPTDTFATLDASFTMVYWVDPYNPFLYPPLAPCRAGSDAISVEAFSGPFNFCTAPNRRRAVARAGGDIELNTTDDDGSGRRVVILMRGGDVVSVTLNTQLNEQLSCTATCTGITVSPPDASNNVAVTFDGTVLYEVQSFPRPGERTVTLRSGPLLFPASPP